MAIATIPSPIANQTLRYQGTTVSWAIATTRRAATPKGQAPNQENIAFN
jgi:hypothetical protein